MPHTTIIIGAYGSGKTECAMALAARAAADGPVTLVDLDFVNPYFRSQDHQAELAALGVTILAPDPRVAAIDAPSIPAHAADVILHPAALTIVDLGGDPAGAIVIAQYAPLMTDYDLWAVVNFARPTTPDPATAAALLQETVAATRLRLTGIVSNTHLGPYTTHDDINSGLAQAQILAELLHVPVTLLCHPPALPIDTDIPTLSITPRLKKPWE